MTIAYWCVLAVILLPYVWFGVFSARVGSARDNNNPRISLCEVRIGRRGKPTVHVAMSPDRDRREQAGHGAARCRGESELDA